MIVTVTLNPCIDQTMVIPSFTHGGLNRVTNVRRDAAGKGINVSAALSQWGIESLCMGFNYRENGSLIENRLDELGIAHDFVAVDGAVRTNIKILEQDTRVMTEVNQPGAYVPHEAVDALTDKIIAAKPDILVLSGSRPQGVGEDIYRRIMEKTSALTLLDTEGGALLEGLTAKPYLIKPNLFELENAFGVTLPTKQAIVEWVRERFMEQESGVTGAAFICVSMGKDGALMISEKDAYYTPALDIPVRGVQGAGDAMVAGIVLGITRQEDTPGLLRYAAAAASASVIREGTQMGTLSGLAEMLNRVEVEKIG